MNKVESKSSVCPAWRRGILNLMVTLGLLTAAAAAYAQQSPLVGYEDIDLFVKSPATGDLPNVLLLLDTSANWSASAANACTTYSDGTAGPKQTNPNQEQGKKIAVQKCALVNTLLALPVNDDGTAKFRVGVMYMNASNANGAYPRVRFLEVTAANKLILAQALKDTSLASAADQGSNADYARALWEAYLWYKGLAPLYGRAQTNASKIRYDLLAFDGSLKYIPPATESCGRNFVIVISNGSPQSTEADIKPLIGNPTAISYSSSYIATSDANNWADETSRFLRGADVSTKDGTQNITTYTVAITSASPSTAEVKSNNFIKEIAVQGGGIGYSATDVSSLTLALNSIFNQIQAVNSVYAAASLPVSVNSQGTFLNQVFLGVFRPDSDAKPRWVGNLKQYKFGYNAATQAVNLVDAAGTAAINPATGFIAPGARSYWTTDRPYLDFWKNMAWPGEVNTGGSSDYVDGQLVEKGGAAQRLRESFMTSQAARNVYTCLACTSGALTSFSDTAAIRTAVYSSNATEATAIINWARGADNKAPSDEKGPGTVTYQATAAATATTVTPTVRPSIHGDIVHSSPAVINYGGSTGVVVFYGANSGMLHAVKGAQTGTGAGEELWSFVPSEFLSKLKRQRDNLPIVQYASTNMTTYPTAQRKDYGMDGPITFYQKQGSGAKAWLYVGMRRGGRALYAFDVTNPASPTLRWKKDNTSTDLSLLGYTWSEARVTRINGITDPVLIMGGGYDPAEDNALPTTSMGNIVVVLNANTGAVLKVFTGISRPVPASVAIVDSNDDAKMDRAYAVDLGGSVYRMTFPSSTVSDWAITKIADFSGSTGTGQKMFYAPSVIKTGLPGESGATTYAVQVGTGDREKPLKASGTDNRFFTVLDRGQTTAKVLTDLTSMTETGLSAIPANSYGCYYNLPTAGEKVVNATTYTSGFSFFGTNAPTTVSATSCAGNLGTARLYAIPALCGPVTVSVLEGGGFPPTAVVGTVLVDSSADGSVNCETNPEQCDRVPVGIGINPPDCQGNVSTIPSAIGATNIYACPPKQRLRRDWSILNPR